MADLSLKQKQTLSQAQVMSQKQIQSLAILACSAEDLCQKIYAEAEKNPALEIVNAQRHTNTTGIRQSFTHSATQDEASDRYMQALEGAADGRTSLKEHLLEQFTVLPLSKSELSLGQALIYNLDEKGFHILSPLSVIDKKDPYQTQNVLEHCLKILQALDPVGTCTKDTEESLFVQAKLKGSAPPLALFILDGHLSFLDPPTPSKVLKKITDYKKEQASLFAAKKNPYLEDAPLTQQAVEDAIMFIRNLDPFPARDFGTDDVHYIAPDVYVERAEQNAVENLEAGIVSDGETLWQLKLSDKTLPSLKINSEMASFAKDKNYKGDKEALKTIKQNVADARSFINLIQMRQNTVLYASAVIVKKQHEFFKTGPGNLVPLRQQDVAKVLGVHETTISRMANKKYIQCEWGLFELKYFFTGSASKANAKDGQNVSRDKVLHEMQDILAQCEKENPAKKISDRELADLLTERGIVIARRTVAKYRSLLNIGSSYQR